MMLVSVATTATGDEGLQGGDAGKDYCKIVLGVLDNEADAVEGPVCISAGKKTVFVGEVNAEGPKDCHTMCLVNTILIRERR